MITLEEFKKDMESCAGKKCWSIYETGTDSVLLKLSKVFGAADCLSVENAGKHQKILLALSVAGTLLTVSFLLYDEVDMYNLIFACGVMLLGLFLIGRIADKTAAHRKYIDYRVLAESLRLQFFLRYAGLSAKVSDMMPWSIRLGSPWIMEEIAELTNTSDAANQELERRSVLDCWIRDQLAYHRKALAKTKKKDIVNRYILRTVLVITIITYLLAVAFEIKMKIAPIEMAVGASIDPAELYRCIIKVALGSLSATTLFVGNYYGKMSLDNVMEDHRRMIALYEKAERDITTKDETGGGEAKCESEALLLDLAREFLNENSTWYAYQSTNRLEISI